jgi:hypothetical protein
MQPVVFSAAWFDQHQRTLLRLLAWPLVGRWFRWVLCIRRHDVGYHGRIVALLPHAYTVANADGTLTTDFRTHAKYAKRLYYAFRPLWWTLHAWDQAIANPFVPALNAGFDTLTAYPDPDPETVSVDGQLAVAIFGDTWANVIIANANAVNDSGTQLIFAGFKGSPNANQWANLWRSMFLFDTSSIGSGVVSDAILSLSGSAKLDDLAASPTVDVYTAAPASNTALATTDMPLVGSVSQTGSALAYASFSTTGYNDFTFNATGRSNIATSGVSKFSIRTANYDAAATGPPYLASTETSVTGFFADQSGSVGDPKLVVTYAPPPLALVTLLGTAAV